MKTKQELRKEILQLRDALTVEERQVKSHRIAEDIIALREFEEADKVLLFASYKSEVDTSEIFEAAQNASKDIYYPKVICKEMEFYQVQEKEDLLEGYRGIREPEADTQKVFRPLSTDKIFILMPGAVFDKEGNRIGYGGGYYDKFLQRMESILGNEEVIFDQQICKTAIAFQCQMVDIGQIINQEHDIKPDYVITEEQIYRAKCKEV